jgi:hypothetical protein
MYPSSNLFLILIQKIFLPHLSLALEYQGEQHYYTVAFFLQRLETRQRIDQAKRNFAAQCGITLISVPFWWDKSSNSLAATIEYFRPDIKLQDLAKDVMPIPMEMPQRFRKHNKSQIHDI